MTFTWPPEDKLTFYLFADDTNLLYADKNLKSLETIINCELFKVIGWLIAIKLLLNIKKTNYIIFHPYQKRISFNNCIKVYDSRTKTFFDFECKDPVKYFYQRLYLSMELYIHRRET